jgi:uncharacterized protein YecE (DUF72 family)
MANLHVGLSGYSYKPWQGEGRFYPPELKTKEFLNYYVARYKAVEMDGTWYRMPGEEAVQGYLKATPDDFKFCFKAHRQVTHMARLKPEALDPLKFMLGRLEPLRGRLGPLLLQLPPNLKREDERLKRFLGELPTLIPAQKQWAVEFRHETWHAPEVETILRDHNVAWVAADTDEAAAQRRDTADFVYARLRRSEYDAESLQAWRRYFDGMGKDCFVFCKHEDEGSPWIWADQLLA